MTFKAIHEQVRNIPFITESNAEKLYNFIVENKIKSVLELGFAHGTSSCYIAAALEETNGKLVSVDLLEAKFKPDIHELLEKTKLKEYVKVVRESTGYTWFLHNDIKASSDNYNCTPKYDLCIIDGPKNWTIDGAAFFMVDKLLLNNGWVIFDDYSWTYANAHKRGRDTTDGITHRLLSDDELVTPHVKEIFQLLVMQHPDYSNFRIHGEGDWAFAQKTIKGSGSKKVTVEYNVTYKDGFSRLFAMLNKIFKFRKVK